MEDTMIGVDRAENVATCKSREFLFSGGNIA